MANHKRGKRKDLRAGCFCKYWKMNHAQKKDLFRPSERRKLQEKIEK